MLGPGHERPEIGQSPPGSQATISASIVAQGRGQAAHAVADLWKAVREVMAVAGEDKNLLATLVQLRAPAVELDLVQPVEAGGGLVRSTGQAGDMNSRRDTAQR